MEINIYVCITESLCCTPKTNTENKFMVNKGEAGEG